jgi:transcriptional regulator of acetoin/glycerol metabolism
MKNALEYATAVCEGQTIHVADLPREIGLPSAHHDAAPSASPRSPEEPGEATLPPETRPLSPSVLAPPAAEPHEARRIRAALEQAHYRRAEAASLLGISRTTLWRKMREHRI